VVEAPEFPEPAAEPVLIPAGTVLSVALNSSVSTATGQSGDEFQGTLTEALRVGGEVVVPAGAAVVGRVVSSVRAGRVEGVARIELTMTGIEAGGERHAISTTPFVGQANTERGEDAARIGGGAGIGAAIGGILGGGDGAAIGAAVGGGAGTAVVLTDRGDDVEILAERPITVELTDTLSIPR
jgi:hypothetical protein